MCEIVNSVLLSKLLSKVTLSTELGGTIGTKINFLKVFKWILLWFQYIRPGKKELLNLVSLLTLLKILKSTTTGSKIKVVVDLSSDCC